MPIRRPKDEVRLDKYFDRKFFIKPFVCAKCGNEIWFEHDLVPDGEIQLHRSDRSKFSDGCLYHYLYGSPYGEADKFCDLCSQDIEYIFRTFDSGVALGKLGDWIDGVPIEKL